MIWCLVFAFFLNYVPTTGFLPRSEKAEYFNFYDRNGVLLWTEKPYFQDGNTNLENPPKSPFNNGDFRDAFMAVEDRNFDKHHGVSGRSVLRALKELIQTGEIQSGASTITMQLATQRYLPHERHDWDYKVRQIIYAWILEQHSTKDEIWRDYADRINFGNGAIGIAAGSERYFSKTPVNLSVGEWAVLVSVLPNPSLYDPVQNPERVLIRRDLILDIWAQAGLITPEEKRFWRGEPLNLKMGNLAELNAPHFIFWIKQNLKDPDWRDRDNVIERIDRTEGITSVYTTLDHQWYQRVRKIVQSEVNSDRDARNLGNASVVVIDNASGAIRVMLGGANYFDAESHGRVNMATASRSSGSILKPFLFLLALEQGHSVLSVLRDDQVSYFQNQGYYRPKNFNAGQTYGAVYFREALTNSYNLSAVYLLNQIGLEPFMTFLKDEYKINFQASADIGLAAILGGLEVNLLEMSQAYRQIAINDSLNKTWITHALSDPVARTRQFDAGSVLELPFDVAVKTGTSQGFRDNWVLGYTPDVTVGVWAGNNNGAPLYTTSGIEGAGPIWNRVMLHLFESGAIKQKEFSYMEGRQESSICRSPDIDPESCHEKFKAYLTRSEFADWKARSSRKRFSDSKKTPKILYPSTGEIFHSKTDLLIKTNTSQRLYYSLNGVISTDPFFENLSVGDYEIKIFNAGNQVLDTVGFQVSD